MKRLFLVLAGLGLGATAHAGLPVLEAAMGPPVIEELMGGCPLRCAFPWQVLAGGPVTATNDRDARAAWTDPRPGGSVGSRLEFRFPASLPRDLRGTPLYGLDLIDGDRAPADGTGARRRRRRDRGAGRTLIKVAKSGRAEHQLPRP